MNLLPLLRGVEDIQNFDGIALDAVGDDIRGDNDLAGQGNTARTTAFGKLFEALAAVPDALCFGLHDLSTCVVCQIGSDSFEVLEGSGSPANVSQRQRSAPTWRRRP